MRCEEHNLYRHSLCPVLPFSQVVAREKIYVKGYAGLVQGKYHISINFLSPQSFKLAHFITD
jgi:hypothetical protein